MFEPIYIFLLAAVPLVGIAVFIFIIAQSAVNAANYGLKQKIIVLKAASSVTIWCAASYAMFEIIGESIIVPINFDSDISPGFFEKYTEYSLFAGLLIYILTGTGLGFWIKGRTKRSAR